MTAYLNGQYLPLSEAKISPMDRGFLFGDGGYEVIPVYSRCPFRMDEHLRRFQVTLDGIRIANPHTIEAWRKIILRLVAEADFVDQAVYLQVTRGTDMKRDQGFPKGDVKPTVFAFTAPMVNPSAAQREKGIGCVTTVDNRWDRCDLKTVALLANCLNRQLAVDVDCVETVMVRDGYLTEGAASNIFVVKNDVILAVPKDHRILGGITYDVVLELAAKHGAPFEVRDISEAELRSADELWMTSSTKEVLPITMLDGKPVGGGKPGPVGKKMYDWYCAFRDEVMRAKGG
jgi:D-alanine transaminase